MADAGQRTQPGAGAAAMSRAATGRTNGSPSPCGTRVGAVIWVSGPPYHLAPVWRL